MPAVAFFPCQISAPELWSLCRLMLASIFSLYKNSLEKLCRQSEVSAELPVGGERLKNFQGLTLELSGTRALWLSETHPCAFSQPCKLLSAFSVT